MSPIERYTPEICSQLRQIAETHQWLSWEPRTLQPRDVLRGDVLEDVELTYHLHLAAEASGARAGMPLMPNFPLRVGWQERSPRPAEFLLRYLRRHPPHPWNQSDNANRSQAARV